jgi:hypothetical protein
MPVIEPSTVIRAPRERVFDLAHSMDAHQDTTSGTVFLTSYMRRFLVHRNKVLKHLAESAEGDRQLEPCRPNTAFPPRNSIDRTC